MIFFIKKTAAGDLTGSPKRFIKIF